MKHGSTLFLKGVIIVVALVAVAICIFAVPRIGNAPSGEYYLHMEKLRYVIMTGLYAAVIPFFVALYQAFRLLNAIDINRAFSELAVNALKQIKYCAVVIAILFAAGLPLIYQAAEYEDAPGLMVIGLAMVGAPIVVAVFAAVLQKLFKNALDITLENESTI